MIPQYIKLGYNIQVRSILKIFLINKTQNIKNPFYIQTFIVWKPWRENIISSLFSDFYILQDVHSSIRRTNDSFLFRIRHSWPEEFQVLVQEVPVPAVVFRANKSFHSSTCTTKIMYLS